MPLPDLIARIAPNKQTFAVIHPASGQVVANLPCAQWDLQGHHAAEIKQGMAELVASTLGLPQDRQPSLEVVSDAVFDQFYRTLQGNAQRHALEIRKGMEDAARIQLAGRKSISKHAAGWKGHRAPGDRRKARKR